jgi:peroxiredoxin
MITKYTFIFCAVLTVFAAQAQSISGKLSNSESETIYLYGYNNFDAYVIDSTSTTSVGEFQLKFSSKDYGMGYLQPAESKPIILVLADEDISLEADSEQLAETVRFTNGAQNIAYSRYGREYPKRQNALSAWRFLNELYTEDTTFSKNATPREAIAAEMQRLNQEDEVFINALPSESYVRWFIPIRQLLGSVSAVAQYRPEEIPATRDGLRAIDFSDTRLYKSGLLKEAIENHIWFIENSSGSLDQVFEDLNQSIDIIIDQLKDDDVKFNLITQRMFEVLEKRSLFTSAEYLAKRLLDGDDCGCLNVKFEKQLNKYGKMARGATAPDIEFTDFTYRPEGVNASRLSELDADYYLVVFAAGWCPHCNEALPKVADLYPDLKSKNIEVVLVSLDETAADFAKFAAPFPFISTTDYKKWEGQAATDYQVFSTPSYFMLDNNRTILQKLNSVEHLKSWVEYKLQ